MCQDALERMFYQFSLCKKRFTFAELSNKILFYSLVIDLTRRAQRRKDDAGNSSMTEVKTLALRRDLRFSQENIEQTNLKS